MIKFLLIEIFWCLSIYRGVQPDWVLFAAGASAGELAAPQCYLR